MIISTYFNKLISNAANRKDPKFIIVFGNRNDYDDINWQSVKFKTLEKKGIKFEKFNSVMMIKHTTKELKEQNIEHFSVERW